MKTTGRILIVDDDRAFLETYRDLLGDEGYEVDTAETGAEAISALSQAEWDVVLLDQRLQGEAGPDTGIDLVSETGRLAPGAKAIVVTAFANARAIERAFTSGAYDYLEKNEIFSAMLRVKVRNATEAVRERRLGAMASYQAEETLGEIWNQVLTESDRNRKGKLLEDLLVLLFKTIPGFHHVKARRQNQQEEVDLLVRNESKDPFWARESAYILVECKNWTKPVGKNEFLAFKDKLERRYDRCRIGFLCALGGFASTFHVEQLTERKSGLLIVPVGRKQLGLLIESPDRNAALKLLHEAAVMAANGCAP